MIDFGPSAAILLVALAICRIGGCFLVLPGLSSDRVPAQVRILIVVVISLSVAQQVWPELQEAGIVTTADLLRAMLGETLIGLFIGLVVRFYLMALSFIANAIGMMVGYGNLMGAGIEATEPQAALGTLVSMTALVMLFAMDFHHAVILGLIGSYRVLPVGGPITGEVMLLNLTATLSESFLLVLRLGSPFIAYALIANVTIGVLNKLTPQIPVYFVSLPYLIFGGLVFLYFGLPLLLPAFIDGLSQAGIFR